MAAKTTKTTTTKRPKPMSEPPAHYAVISVTDEHEQVWHYPVLVGASIGGHAVAGEQCPVPYFMSPELRTATGRLKRPATAVRFKTRARAVRFAYDAAALDRTLLQELKQALG